MTPDAIFAEPKLAEIYDLLMLAKAEWLLDVPEFLLYAPRRRLFWQNEKGESVRSLSHPS
ncbi:hypothetical protein KSC_030460 [Ktedonobacter sp. SOSP1-52]|uniref:hypothetical protein n=1 Tax=Ktedonobacter sp. SOSP1-52 TaxID=2778366 RepID=UPI0019165CED|nr:hypothetical protein [Ktedonobacter sp. SOSP1-52]GHO64154.1 hypothetical protein KSC_030460 [Ktedonobacter sp. SOSP1-52]